MNTLSEMDSASIEKNALSIGKWANLFMAFAGIAAAWASRSDALLVDGLYSGVNFVSAIIAGQVGMSISRQPDQYRPFGYEADEAIYVTFRSMALAGILTFATFNALAKILNYLAGNEIPELVFGPIQLYVILMVLICAGLAYFYHQTYLKTGRRSQLLLTERQGAIVDGSISAGAGIALLLIPLLEGTIFGGIIPIADAIVVLVLTLFIIRQPISMFRSALGEIAGESASREHVESVRNVLTESSGDGIFQVTDLAVTKLGRRFTVVGFLKPEEAVTAAQVDAFNAEFHDKCANILGDVRTEIIVTEKRRFGDEKTPDNL